MHASELCLLFPRCCLLTLRVTAADKGPVELRSVLVDKTDNRGDILCGGGLHNDLGISGSLTTPVPFKVADLTRTTVARDGGVWRESNAVEEASGIQRQASALDFSSECPRLELRVRRMQKEGKTQRLLQKRRW